MAFLDWIAPLSPIRRDETRTRVFSADICPLTYSFWVVDAEDDREEAEPAVHGDPRRRTSGAA